MRTCLVRRAFHFISRFILGFDQGSSLRVIVLHVGQVLSPLVHPAPPPGNYFETCAGTPFRYSATLVLGLGSVHVCLGAVSAILAITALFVETDVNGDAAGLWTGIVYIGCGITGILAYSR